MPTIVNGLSSENILLKKNYFYLSMHKEYDRFDEAMAMCNNSEYGLTAGIFQMIKKK
jgi:acyl-CoA reductase-like NAD-dependent aldehyde dehydrogenase